MVMSERSTVVGVFTEDQYANLAADELRRVGFSDDEISVYRHKDEEGSLAGLKRLFKGQETTPEATANDFMRMGVPEQDAHYYQSELDAGHTIVLVRVAGQEQQVLEILRKNGGMTSPRPIGVKLSRARRKPARDEKCWDGRSARRWNGQQPG